MTGFASTGTFSTAASPVMTVAITFTPPVLVMAALMSAFGGASPNVEGQLQSQPSLQVHAGARASGPSAAWALSPLAVPLAGASVVLSIAGWSFEAEAFVVSAGAHAAVATDVVVEETRSTAAFSTARWGQGLSVVRTEHAMRLIGDLSVKAGALLTISVTADIEPNDHGPVVRSTGVKGLITMS